MDKQKQMIEEMAKIIYQFDPVESNELKIAEFIIGKGYRKIPENAVVLTREEYEELEKAVDSVQVAVSSFTRLETLYKIKCKELELAEEKVKEITEGKV